MHEILKLATWRIEKLLAKFGPEGYGTLCIIYQMIENDPDKRIPTDTTSYLSQKYAINVTTLISIIEFSISELGIFVSDGDAYYLTSHKKAAKGRKVLTNGDKGPDECKMFEELGIQWDELKTPGEENTALVAVKGFLDAHKPSIAEPYVRMWNIQAKRWGLSQVMEINKTRMEKIATRVKEPLFDFPNILKAINKSNYLKGKTTDWRCDFNWIIENESNYLNILEGKYQ